MDPEELARNKVKATNNALPVLIARAGGSVTITHREFEEVLARYGGSSQVAIRMERLDASDPQESGIRLTLVRKSPEQGELPV
jgi:hypothetical protein